MDSHTHFCTVQICYFNTMGTRSFRTRHAKGYAQLLLLLRKASGKYVYFNGICRRHTHRHCRSLLAILHGGHVAFGTRDFYSGSIFFGVE